MIFMILYLFCVTVALGLGGVSAHSDLRGMTIPNYIAVLVVLAFVGAFCADYYAQGAVFDSVESHLIAGGIVFCVTFIMFFLKMIGGGDSKLVTAFSFWVGLKGLMVFLFYMSALGCLLALFALYLKRRKPVKAPAEGSWIARVQAGESVVPYGVPIALGALVAFIQLGYLDPAVLSLFLMPS